MPDEINDTPVTITAREMGKKGGSARTKKKAEAGKKNLVKARQAIGTKGPLKIGDKVQYVEDPSTKGMVVDTKYNAVRVKWDGSGERSTHFEGDERKIERAE